MSKVVISGGAGYIGSAMVDMFLYRGDKVNVVDTLMYDKTSLLPYIQRYNFSFTKGDVRNKDVLDKILKEADVIIPLAALVGAPLCAKNPIDAKLVNQEQIEYLAKHKSKDQLILFPNTNSGYGTKGNEIITEEDLLTPNSIYGETKCAAERAVRDVENHVVFRLATVFGVSKRMRTDLLVNNLVLRAMKDKVLIVYEGNYMRNYIHIEDVVSAFGFVIDNWNICKNQVYNLGNDAINMSKLQLCEEIKKVVPCEIIQANYTSDIDKRNYIVSSQKIYDKGFRCCINLNQGIKELVKAYEMLDQPDRYANY